MTRVFLTQIINPKQKILFVSGYFFNLMTAVSLKYYAFSVISHCQMTMFDMI